MCATRCSGKKADGPRRLIKKCDLFGAPAGLSTANLVYIFFSANFEPVRRFGLVRARSGPTLARVTCTVPVVQESVHNWDDWSYDLVCPPPPSRQHEHMSTCPARTPCSTVPHTARGHSMHTTYPDRLPTQTDRGQSQCTKSHGNR